MTSTRLPRLPPKTGLPGRAAWSRHFVGCARKPARTAHPDSLFHAISAQERLSSDIPTSIFGARSLIPKMSAPTDISRLLRSFLAWRCLAVIVLLPASLYFSLWNEITPRGVIVHHSTLPITVQGADYFDPDVRVLDAYHKTRGFGTVFQWKIYHIGYHFVIHPDGRVERGRPEHCQGAHARSFNDYLGICLIGDFSRRDNPTGALGSELPTPEEWKALLTLTSSLVKKYHLDIRDVRGHWEVSSHTECPGDRIDMNALRLQLRSMRSP